MVDKPGQAADLYLSLDDEALVAQCDIDRYRSRGPGGQKRNKTSSAVRLRHRPTGLSVIATEDRSQHVNRRRAVRRLREAIALGVRSDSRTTEGGSDMVLASCFDRRGHLCVGRRDLRYYSVVAEILDLLAAHEVRVAEVAKCVGLTTAGLVGFIRADPKFWKRVNEMRAAAGVKPLR